MNKLLIPADLKEKIARAVVISGHSAYAIELHGQYYVGDRDKDGVADFVENEFNIWGRAGKVVEVSRLLGDAPISYADVDDLRTNFLSDHPDLYKRFCRWAKRHNVDQDKWEFWNWAKEHPWATVRKTVNDYEQATFELDVEFIMDYIVDEYEFEFE